MTVSAGSTTVDEGTPADDGSTTAGNEVTLTVTRSGVTDGQATVAVQSTDGSAQGGSDFETVSETVEFADGETEQTVTLTTTPDDVRESDEGLTVSLGSPSTGSVSADNGSVEVTIANDDENQLPVITAPSETNAFIGDDTGVSGISFTDADDNTGFTVTVSAEGSSEVSFSSSPLNATAVDAAGNSISTNETANTIVLSGTETAINDDLENLEFVTNATTPGTETLSIEVEDTVGGTDSQDVTVNVGNQVEFTNDTDDDLTGSSGADIFKADQSGPQADIQNGDQADGGNGTDTLEVTNAGANALNVFASEAVSNIEILDITLRENNNNDTITVDADQFSNDLTDIRFTTADGSSPVQADDDKLTVTNLSSGTNVVFNNDAGAFTVTSVASAGTSDSVSVTLAGGVTLADIADTSASPGTLDNVTIASNGTGDEVNEVSAVGSAGDLATNADITLTGSQNLTVNGIADQDLGSIDGSAATGDLTVDASAVATDSGSGADAFSIAGGSGKDTLTGSGTKATILTGNGGDDSLTGGTAADTLTGGAGADDLTGGGENDTFVFASGDGGSASDARDQITDLSEGDQLDVTDFGDFGLSDGDTLGTSASDASAAEIFIDRTNNRIVIETSADGSTTEEIDISEVAAESAFTFDDGADDTVGTSDDRIEVGAAPLTPTNDNTGTLTVVGKVSGGGNVDITVDDGNAPTVGGSTVGSAAVTTIDVSEITNNGADIITDTGNGNVETTPTTSLDITGSQQGDVIAGGTAGDEITGGTGSDEFRFGTGDGGDEITDFVSGADAIGVSNSDFSISAGTLGAPIEAAPGTFSTGQITDDSFAVLTGGGSVIDTSGNDSADLAAINAAFDSGGGDDGFTTAADAVLAFVADTTGDGNGDEVQIWFAEESAGADNTADAAEQLATLSDISVTGATDLAGNFQDGDVIGF